MNNINKEFNLRENFKVLKIIFFGLILGQLLFFAVTLYLYFNELIEAAPSLFIFKFGTPLLIILLIFLSRILYTKRVNSADKSVNIKSKFDSFKLNNIIKWAFLEGANLLVIISFLFTGYILYAILFFIVIMLFVLNYPVESRFIYEYQINENEVKNG